MELARLAERIGARIITPAKCVSVEPDQVYAGDRISDLLNAAGESALLVSNLVSSHLVRVAELMDVPALCLVNGRQPDPVSLETARGHGTTIMVSPCDLFETCGRLYTALGGEKPAVP
jgi:hypothetical protein